MSRPVFRFAPSPNGALHLGHALSAITGFEIARRMGGRFLLRIEDIDATRARPEFVQAIFDDLEWLGVTWEEPVLRQSEHLADYSAAVQPLFDAGLLYKCFASRTDIASAGDPEKRDPDGAVLYPGIWREKSRDQAAVAEAKARDPRFALRLDMAKAIEAAREKLGGKPLTFTELNENGEARQIIADPAPWGDVVVLRRELPASYLIAVIVDDARQGVTHVTRGMDLFAATDVQRLLQVLLGLPEPLYHHHRLILGNDGRKLSKSQGDTSLAHLRSKGASRADIRRLCGLE